MNVLITGAGGFLGRGMTPVLARGNTLRLADIRPFESTHEVMAGDVASLDDAHRMVAGMDALVLGHMASRQDEAYATPPLPFDINVKGTAEHYHRMHGVSVAVLRPGWIVDADSALTKYGTPFCFASNLIGRRASGGAYTGGGLTRRASRGRSRRTSARAPGRAAARRRAGRAPRGRGRRSRA